MSRETTRTHQWFMLKDNPAMAGCPGCGTMRRLNSVLLMGECPASRGRDDLDMSRPLVIPDKGKPYFDVPGGPSSAAVNDKFGPHVA